MPSLGLHSLKRTCRHVQLTTSRVIGLTHTSEDCLPMLRC